MFKALIAQVKGLHWWQGNPEVIHLEMAPKLLSREYHIHRRKEAFVDGGDLANAQHRSAIPVVLLSESALQSKEILLHTIESWLQLDDVFSGDFLSPTLVLPYATRPPSFLKAGNLSTAAGVWSPEHFLCLRDHSKNLPLPDGPYFLLGNSLHQAWALHVDSLDSFATSIIPNVDNTEVLFEPLHSTGGHGIWKYIAVPSRLYSRPTGKQPLSGIRVSVKDCFRIQGVQTTQSNRAFVELYGPEQYSARYVRKLHDLGGAIVGKTKLCAFASSEEATDQWIDFHAPFNPRADGYQSPSGSSTGAATALAGYSWVDISIGTDTTGSIRWPAAWNGVFGLRTSHGAANLDGVFYSCRQFDTLGIMSRSLDTLSHFWQHTMDVEPAVSFKYPKHILYPTDFFPYANEKHQAMIDSFLTILEQFLGVVRTEFSIAERWKENPPPEAHGKSLPEYIDKTAFNLFYWDGYHGFDDFRKEYEAQFGKPPYVGPYMRWKWEVGAEITEDQVKQSLSELDVYRRWFNANIIPTTRVGDSDAVLILPCGSSEPKYRDDPNKPPGPVSSFSMNYIASMLELPQVVLPIGQLPYHSRVSKQTEYLPVVGTMAGAKGSDLMLLSLAKEALEQAGWATEVKIGRNAFAVGDNSRFVTDPGTSNARGPQDLRQRL